MSDSLFATEEKSEAPTATLPAKINTEDRLLEKVLDSGNIEVLERYIALRKSEEERQARINFEEHFAKMRAELPVIVKTKEGNKGKFKYAPVEDLQRQCDPIIFRHGFTYSWREESISDGKRVWFDIFGYGHTRSNYFDSPQMDPVTTREGDAVQNLIQVRGVMSTYGRRYSFAEGLGLVIEGEDSDGQITDDVDVLEMDLREFIKSGKLSPEACSMITKALLEDPLNPGKLKAFYKRARTIVGGKR